MAAPPASARRGRSRVGLPAPKGLGPVWAWVVAVVVLAPATATLAWMVVSNLGSGAAALEAIGGRRTVQLLVNTLGLVAATTVTAVGLGLTAAWITTRTDLRGRRTWSVLVALPIVFPSYVGALALIGAFGPDGIVSVATGLSIPRPGGFSGSWLALSLFGGEVIRGFSLALVWGVVIGTYSSIGIAVPLLLYTGVRRSSLEETTAEARP